MKPLTDRARTEQWKSEDRAPRSTGTIALPWKDETPGEAGISLDRSAGRGRRAIGRKGGFDPNHPRLIDEEAPRPATPLDWNRGAVPAVGSTQVCVRIAVLDSETESGIDVRPWLQSLIGKIGQCQGVYLESTTKLLGDSRQSSQRTPRTGFWLPPTPTIDFRGNAVQDDWHK